MPDIPMKREIESTKGVLQDLVVVVSLVRTLTDSFGSASDLYRKLKRKSKDLKEDIKEDIQDHIREDIKDQIEEHHQKHGRRNRRDSHSDDDRDRRRPPRWRSRSRSRRGRDDSRDSDEESIETSSALVRAEFDRGVHYVGERFANGDLITRNQLQSQIIALQQTLLYIYEDIILNADLPRHPPSFHLRQLVQTARAARTASIEALAMQCQRMLPPPETREPLALPGTFPASPTAVSTHEVVVRGPKSNTARSVAHGSDSGTMKGRSESATVIAAPAALKAPTEMRRTLSSNSSTSTRSVKGTPLPTPTATPKPLPGSLFCVYAQDLQRSHSLPLSDNFKSGGDNRCPYCHAHVPSRPNKAWELVKEDEKRKGVERTFLVGTRFMVKSHREGGGYACPLCCEYRDADTVCSEVRALVEHLWKDHTCKELEWDENIGEEK